MSYRKEYEDKKSSIQLHVSTKRRMKKLAIKPRESYESILLRLLDYAEKK